MYNGWSYVSLIIAVILLFFLHTLQRKRLEQLEKSINTKYNFEEKINLVCGTYSQSMLIDFDNYLIKITDEEKDIEDIIMIDNIVGVELLGVDNALFIRENKENKQFYGYNENVSIKLTLSNIQNLTYLYNITEKDKCINNLNCPEVFNYAYQIYSTLNILLSKNDFSGD